MGKLPGGIKLPKELDFAKDLGVAVVTLRSALQRLQDENLIIRIPSKGTFVIDQNKNNLERGKILIIDIAFKGMESPANYILPGIENAAAKLGYETIVCDKSFIDAISVYEFKISLKKNNIMGVILATAHFLGTESLVKKLQTAKIPVVVPNADPTDSETTGFASISILKDKAWIDAISHLHDQGHNQLATLVLTKDGFRGFSKNEHLSLLKAYDMSTDKKLLGYSPYEQKQTTKVINAWLKLPSPPTAILCFSDFLAIRVYEALKQQQIRIPDDIAVMGCCGYPGKSFMSPPLSTIDFEYTKLGQKSVELLVTSEEWFFPNTKKSAPKLIHPYQLVIRESTIAG